MPQSLSNILLHLIWSTKDRHPWLTPGIREKTHAFLTGAVRQCDFDAYPVRGAAAPGTLERHLGALAVWHVYYAMQGLLLDQAQHRLRIVPKLPKGVDQMNSLIITPACLGWLRYQEERPNGYRQRIRVAFDSPVNIDEIELRLPPDVTRFTVMLEVSEGTVDVVMSTQPLLGAQQLRIRPRRPMMATRAVSVLIAEVADAG